MPTPTPVAGNSPDPGRCSACGGPPPAVAASYVYAIGRIEPHVPRSSVEKEFAQAVSRAETAAGTMLTLTSRGTGGSVTCTP
ncbi:hypothetical protein [Kitasatospora sp. NPDC089509]|uniref:hypothetical protein n=1 Tax=Kitasatospora sp. NPDC089509 TaxID=3364079 RepID=UPI0038243581